MDVKQIGGQSLPSILKDPFSKTCVYRVYVSYSMSDFSGDWRAIGSVEFKNGNTKGNQTFEADNFDDCTKQIRDFINSL